MQSHTTYYKVCLECLTDNPRNDTLRSYNCVEPDNLTHKSSDYVKVWWLSEKRHFEIWEKQNQIPRIRVKPLNSERRLCCQGNLCKYAHSVAELISWYEGACPGPQSEKMPSGIKHQVSTYICL